MNERFDRILARLQDEQKVFQEIQKILRYTKADVSKQDVESLLLRSRQIVTQTLFNNGPDKMDLDQLLRGYSAALNTNFFTRERFKNEGGIL